jgi:hypothetical protein
MSSSRNEVVTLALSGQYDLIPLASMRVLVFSHKKQKIVPSGGPKFVFAPTLYLYLTHAKFQNPTIIPSGRKKPKQKREREQEKKT